MTQLVGVAIIGVVENMAYFTCPDTHKQHHIFGPSHAHEVIEACGAPLLAQLPIDPQISTLCDNGKVEAVTLQETQELLKSFLNAAPVKRTSKTMHT